MTRRDRNVRRRAFTLVEILVVVAIMLIVSAAAIPMVMGALNERRVSSAALLIQAELSRVRDSAVRANAPRGIRLIPETNASLPRFAFSGPTPAYTRMIPIEPGPDYIEGTIEPGISATAPAPAAYRDVPVPGTAGYGYQATGRQRT